MNWVPKDLFFSQLGFRLENWKTKLISYLIVHALLHKGITLFGASVGLEANSKPRRLAGVKLTPLDKSNTLTLGLTGLDLHRTKAI